MEHCFTVFTDLACKSSLHFPLFLPILDEAKFSLSCLYLFRLGFFNDKVSGGSFLVQNSLSRHVYPSTWLLDTSHRNAQPSLTLSSAPSASNSSSCMEPPICSFFPSPISKYAPLLFLMVPNGLRTHPTPLLIHSFNLDF